MRGGSGWRVRTYQKAGFRPISFQNVPYCGLCVDSSLDSASFEVWQMQSIIHVKMRKLGNWETCSNIFAKMDRVLLSPKI